MRTLLTYVLAITLLTVMATTPIVVIGAIVYAEDMGHGGDWPSFSAWSQSLSNTGLFAGLVAIALVLIAAPTWMVWQRGFAAMHRKFGRYSNLLGGPLVALTVGFAALGVRAAIWFSDFKQSPIGETGFYLGVAAISGLVWGSVFWLRQPKNNQTMEVAA